MSRAKFSGPSGGEKDDGSDLMSPTGTACSEPGTNSGPSLMPGFVTSRGHIGSTPATVLRSRGTVTVVMVSGKGEGETVSVAACKRPPANAETSSSGCFRSQRQFDVPTGLGTVSTVIRPRWVLPIVVLNGGDQQLGNKPDSGREKQQNKTKTNRGKIDGISTPRWDGVHGTIPYAKWSRRP